MLRNTDTGKFTRDKTPDSQFRGLQTLVPEQTAKHGVHDWLHVNKLCFVLSLSELEREDIAVYAGCPKG